MRLRLHWKEALSAFVAPASYRPDGTGGTPALRILLIAKCFSPRYLSIVIAEVAVLGYQQLTPSSHKHSSRVVARKKRV